MDLFIQQLKNRDVKSFKKFFKKHYVDLVHYANNFLFDVEQSKDVVQDCFIYIWEHADALNINTTVIGYLKTMVRNKCLNHLKSLKITQNLDILEFNAELSSEITFNEPEKKQTEEQFKALLSAIDDLPSEMAKVVKYKYFNNYKYQEIASALNISINTVKTQLKRAKQKLNQRFTSLFL